LKDSASERAATLRVSPAEGEKLAKAERKELKAATKQGYRVNDLRTQVLAVSIQTMLANNYVQSSTLQTLIRVSGMVRVRKTYGIEIDAGDVELVRHALERQHRAEAIAATTVATVAAYEAWIREDGDRGDGQGSTSSPMARSRPSR